MKCLARFFGSKLIYLQITADLEFLLHTTTLFVTAWLAARRFWYIPTTEKQTHILKHMNVLSEH